MEFEPTRRILTANHRLMRVLQIVSANDINGAVTHVLQLVRQFERRGHEVYLACPPHAWIADQLPAEQVLRSTLGRWPLDEVRRVAQWARERNVDVCHTHQSRAHSFGVMLRWLQGLPSVATAHNCRVQLHWALNNQVIGVSERTTRFHRRFNLVARRQSETVHNFVDAAPFSRAYEQRNVGLRARLLAEFGIPSDRVVGAVVGSVMEKKGLHYLIDALPAVLKQAPQFHLLVVGQPRPRDEDYAAALREQARALQVDSAITWAGSRRDVPELLGASDLLISASLEENFPISMLEAMAARLPIVATTVGGVPECVVDGETGRLLPPKDAVALGEAIAHLALSDAQRRAWGVAGQRRQQRHFSADSQMPKIEAVLARAARLGDMAKAA